MTTWPTQRPASSVVDTGDGEVTMELDPGSRVLGDAAIIDIGEQVRK